MNLVPKSFVVALISLSGTLMPVRLASIQEDSSKTPSEESLKVRTLLSRPLSKLDGNHLRISLVEVYYGPGEASAPHSHPCPVSGYIVAGAIRNQVKGEPEKIIKAGESFYEEANSIHLVSQNASSTEPAKFIAFFVCDQDTPLTVAPPESKNR